MLHLLSVTHLKQRRPSEYNSHICIPRLPPRKPALSWRRRGSLTVWVQSLFCAKYGRRNAFAVTADMNIECGCAFSYEYVKSCLYCDAFTLGRILDSRTFSNIGRIFTTEDICFCGSIKTRRKNSMYKNIWITVINLMLKAFCQNTRHNNLRFFCTFLVPTD